LPDPPQDMPSMDRDPDDAVFVRLAMAARVSLITGDGDLADLRGATGIRVMSVAELWHLVTAGDS